MLLLLTFRCDRKTIDLKSEPGVSNLIIVRDHEGTAEIPSLETHVLELKVARQVRHKLGLDGDVILNGDVSHGDVIVAPLVKELHLTRQGIGRHDRRCT